MSVPLTPADLDRIEALAKGATPGRHAWGPAPDQLGMVRVERCECGILRGIRDGSSTVRWYVVNGEVIRSTYPSTQPPCVPSLPLPSDTVLALVDAARRCKRCADERRRVNETVCHCSPVRGLPYPPGVLANFLRELPTDEARVEALRGICHHCGRVESEDEPRGCQCWNDE